MLSSSSGYWFRSTLFVAEPGEDEETNPRMFGRQPANWIAQKLRSIGYIVEDAYGDDWGWCVMCQRQPFHLFVACVSLRDLEFAKEGDPPPPQEKLLWNVVCMADISTLKCLFRRKPDVSTALNKLDADLGQLLSSDRGITLVDAALADDWFRVSMRG